MCPYKLKTGKMKRSEFGRFDACVYTQAVLAIPLHIPGGDMRVLAAMGQPFRTHNAVSGMKRALEAG